MCPECQLQKSKKSLKSTVTKPIRSFDFASRGQVDLIDMQTGRAMNEPYNFLLVYQDHLTKFIVLWPLKRKTAAEVTSILLDIFCLIGPPHILQSDNGKEFKKIKSSERSSNHLQFQKYPQLQRYLSHNRLQYHCILLLHVPLARMSLLPHRYCLWICWYKFALFVRQNAQVLTSALVVTIRSIQPVAILSTGWKDTDVLCGVSPAG